MNFEFGPALTAWREEVRGFLAGNVTPELRIALAHYGTDHRAPEILEFRARMAEKGWRSLTWPRHLGGSARSQIELEILNQELEYWGVAEDDVTVTSIAPTIIRFGSDANRADWLPGIRSGEITMALGYSETEAGTDLASVRTTAKRDGDSWVISGAKLWNSQAHLATHEWLCVRTGDRAERHHGLSVLIVPTDAPGVAIRPIGVWADAGTNITTFDDVRVPLSNLVGEENRGWTYVTAALYLERAAIAGVGRLRRNLHDLLDYLGFGQEYVSVPGRRQHPPWVMRGVARLVAEQHLVELLAWEVAALIDAGQTPHVESAELKIRSSEFRQSLATFAMDAAGIDGQLLTCDPSSPAQGAFERLYREAPLLRFGGGTNEILRDVVARTGHGLPRAPRG